MGVPDLQDAENRTGAVINVAPGRMRNYWLPRGFAQYVTADQLESSGEQVVDRDPTYGIQQTQLLGAEAQEESEERELDIQVPLLKVTFAFEPKYNNEVLINQ